MNKWTEIFRTGKHTDSAGNSREWTEQDLDRIAAGYNPAQYESPVVIGHPALNAPAFGWVEALKRKGDTLLALFKQIAPEFSEMVKQGRFKKISVALTPDLGLRHIGFLGAAAPAVAGLKNVEFADAAAGVAVETLVEETIANEVTESFAREDALQLQFADLLMQLQLLDKKIESITLPEKKRELPANNQTTNAAEMFSQFADEKTKHGYLTPAQGTLLMRIVKSRSNTGDLEFSENTLIETLKQFVELLPKQAALHRFAFSSPKRDEPATGSIEHLSKIFAARTK